jgi:hypothetical protein
MKLSTKLAIGGALALASVSAFAQVSVPTPPYSGTLTNSNTGNGSAILTLFSANDATPYSYEFNLGLNFNDLLPANGMNTAGTTLTWSLTGLTLPGGVSTSDLLFDVTAAAQTGSIIKAGSFSLLTTVDPSVALATVQGTTSGVLQAGTTNNSNFITNLNASSATNPKTTTTTSDPTYANANYNSQLNALPYNAAGSVNSALSFFELVSNKATTSIATVTQYAGTWSINLANDTLTYSVAGGGGNPPPVPLPAGLWLLLSGLTGMGVLGRRKNTTEAVAA